MRFDFVISAQKLNATIAVVDAIAAAATAIDRYVFVLGVCSIDARIIHPATSNPIKDVY